MERVETLLQKLQRQFNDGVSVEQLLMTVQMLQHELTHVQGKQAAEAKGSVIVSMPLQTIIVQPPLANDFEKKPEVKEKIVEVLQVDEAEVAAELEEIKRNAAVR